MTDTSKVTPYDWNEPANRPYVHDILRNEHDRLKRVETLARELAAHVQHALKSGLPTTSRGRKALRGVLNPKVSTLLAVIDGKEKP